MVAIPQTFPKAVGTPEADSILLANYEGLTIGSTATLDINSLYAIPLFVPSVTTVDGLVCENTSAGDTGEKIRLGLYGSTTGGLPGSLLGETGEITLDGTADVRIGAMSASVTLIPTQKYWLAAVFNTDNTAMLTTTAASTAQFSAYMSRMGAILWNAGLPFYDGTNIRHGVVDSHTFGALPNPFGTVIDGITAMPVLGVQVA